MVSFVPTYQTSWCQTPQDSNANEMQSQVCITTLQLIKLILRVTKVDLRKHLRGVSLKSMNKKYLIFTLDIPLCCINCRIAYNYHQHNTVTFDGN